MNYVPDFDKVVFIVGIMGCVAGLLILFRQADEELKVCCKKRLWRNWVCYGVSISVPLTFGLSVSNGWEWLALWVLGVYLLVCTVTDSLLCQVYDVMQYIGVLGGGIWLIEQKTEPNIGFSLIFFALIQYLVLIRMYGKADGMGYCICALYLAGAGIDIEGYLYHMVISFGLLAVVQGAKGNIAGKGNLKKAVALYPYISLGFLIMWIFIF